MSSPYQEGYNTTMSPLSIDAEDGRLQLTPEEVRILKQCNNEGITRRGLPLALTFGVISHLAAKQNPFMNHKKFGTIPIVLASGFIGYFTGRLSYFPVCYERLMQVPDGIVRRKALSQQQVGSIASRIGQVPVQVEPPKDAYTQSRPTDIDLPIMSNFDTIPSNLDSDTPQLSPLGPTDTETPRKYTTYDELRERNRREYMEKMQGQGYPPLQPGYPPAQPGYPPTQPGYSPAQPGYPPVQPGYPPVQPGYPPAQPGYPPAQPGYSADQILPPSQYPTNQPVYQRRGVPVQPGDAEMTPTQGTGQRKVRTKYGDEWE